MALCRVPAECRSQCRKPSCSLQPCDSLRTPCSTLQATLPAAFTFNNTLSPIVTSVEPAYGSSSGGTLITLTGSALAPLAARPGSAVILETDFFQTAVQIGRVPCQVSMGPQTLEPQV